ncbi:MAG: hypothetical protein JO285_12580 [Kutzneria sp.]|nr:hypothetical protein [Kutzneria sp.]
MSSGNLTGGRPAVTAAEADEAFQRQLLVIDGDAHRDLSRPHGSSTMLRIDPRGDIRLVRSGVQDALSDPDHYLDDALRRGRAALGDPGR